ncbi:MAG: PD-(D/E)XK nuclease family protein, partial [bacterium]
KGAAAAAALADERAWQAARDEAIALGARALPFRTSRAPVARLGASRDGADDESARDAFASVRASDDGRAAEFGRLVHELMNALPRLDAADLAVTAEALAAAQGLDAGGEQVGDALDVVRALLDDSVIDRARRASRYRREIPFAVPLDGALAEGRIDLLFEEAGEIVFVDYKTNRLEVRDAATEAALRAFAAAHGHLAQAALYAHALHAAGLSIREGVFLYPRARARLVLTGAELLGTPLPPIAR